MSNPFTKKTLVFLAELERHNDRDWFKANKDRYEEHVLGPALALVAALKAPLKKVTRHVVVDDKKVGGSLMRIYRDVRFSKDKRPYNPYIAMRFRHADGPHGPGFYLRIRSDAVDAGTGIWQPEPDKLKKIRDHIVANTRAWQTARNDPAFKKVFGDLEGDVLKRPPRGFDPDHPCVEDLKRKDFVGFRESKVSLATRKDLVERLCADWKASTKLNRFLAKAVGVDW